MNRWLTTVLLIVPAILIFTSVDSKMAELSAFSDLNNSWPLSTSSRLMETCGTSAVAWDGPVIIIANSVSKTKLAMPKPTACHPLECFFDAMIASEFCWEGSRFSFLVPFGEEICNWLFRGVIFFMSLFQIAPMVSREAHHRGVMNTTEGRRLSWSCSTGSCCVLCY